MGEQPQSSLKPAANDIDLYCLECGYNLRGLSGDPRRCPECGHLNPMGDLELPADVISAQLRRMETSPALCVGAVLCAAAFMTLIAFILVFGGANDFGGVFCLGMPTFASVTAWLVCARRFRDSCLGKVGWSSALWRYHVYGLGLSVAVVGLLMGPMILYGLLSPMRSSFSQLASGLIPVLSVVAVLAFIATAGRWAHRRLKEILTPLQREVAVTLARDVLRRRLRSTRRW